MANDNFEQNNEYDNYLTETLITVTREALVEALEAHQIDGVYRGQIRGYAALCTCGWESPDHTTKDPYTGFKGVARNEARRKGYLHIWNEIHKMLDVLEDDSDG